MIYEVTVDGRTLRVELNRDGASWTCRVGARQYSLEVFHVRGPVFSLVIGNRVFEVAREQSASAGYVWVNGTRYAAEATDPRSLRSRRAAAGTGDGPQQLLAPMPGKVVRILRGVDQAVEAGQGVLVVEAMKMQNELKSPKAGVVRKILVSEGTAVNGGDLLAVVE